MKELKFTYDMSLSFDSVIRNHRFTIKCQPHDDDRQKIVRLNTTISPNDFISDGVDSFGNKCIYGYMPGEHDLFLIHVDGVAQCGLSDRITSEDMNMSVVYKYPTEITRAGSKIRAFSEYLAGKYDLLGQGENINGRDVFARANIIMNELFNIMEYVPGSTVITSTAEEAFRLGKGVCQDYAHIFLSLLRLERIPCRYVVGFMKGEGESHAWCEIYDEDGIFALDPTNNIVVTDEHIKVSCGRDYSDCLINTGTFNGNAVQLGKISVIVN